MNLRLELESVIKVIEDECKPASEIGVLLRNVLFNYDKEQEEVTSQPKCDCPLCRDNDIFSGKVNGAGTG